METEIELPGIKRDCERNLQMCTGEFGQYQSLGDENSASVDDTISILWIYLKKKKIFLFKCALTSGREEKLASHCQ